MGDEKSCLNCGAARADGSCEHFTGNHDWCGDERRYWVPIASRSPHEELRARVAELEGEVERLKVLNDEYAPTYRTCLECEDRHKAEVERLTKERDEARAVWAAEAVSLRARLNDALVEVRRLEFAVRGRQLDVDNCIGELRSRNTAIRDLEVEVRRLQADNERMRRGMEAVVPLMLQHTSVSWSKATGAMANLLAGRECNSADGAKGKANEL